MTIDDNYKSPFEDHEWQEGYNIGESGFKKGAEWMLEKAIEYIEDRMVASIQPCIQSVIDDFRKAMEE